MDIEIKWNEHGLIPAVTQDANTGRVLMLAWMNQEALNLTLTTGQAHYWSRSRQQLWHKGATSGNVQYLRELWLDCDGDTLLLKVHPAGPACHTGQPTCFFQQLTQESLSQTEET
jgi:phosphoribosyl-AMP cyclohydrolase